MLLVSWNLICFESLCVSFLIYYVPYQPNVKKGGTVKCGGNKKSDGIGQLKSSKTVEPPEDIEVNE